MNTSYLSRIADNKHYSIATIQGADKNGDGIISRAEAAAFLGDIKDTYDVYVKAFGGRISVKSFLDFYLKRADFQAALGEVPSDFLDNVDNLKAFDDAARDAALAAGYRANPIVGLKNLVENSLVSNDDIGGVYVDFASLGDANIFDDTIRVTDAAPQVRRALIENLSELESNVNVLFNDGEYQPDDFVDLTDEYVGTGDPIQEATLSDLGDYDDKLIRLRDDNGDIVGYVIEAAFNDYSGEHGLTMVRLLDADGQELSAYNEMWYAP